VLEDDPVGRLKVYVYELPTKYNKKMVAKDSRCLSHMFAAEIFMHRFLLSSAIRTLNPEEADWFYTPVYTTCDLTPWGHPLPFKSPRIMRSAVQFISKRWPYWNRTEGADHFFVVPHDFGACFHYQVIKLEFRTSELFFFHTVFPSHLLQFASRIIRLMRIKKQLMFRKRRLSIEESFRCFAVLRWSRLSGRRTMSASRKGLSPSHHTLLHRK
jgi:hypothetical protein